MLYLMIAPLIWFGIALTVALAWWKGGQAERIGAGLVLIASLIALAVHLSVPPDLQATALLAGEAGLAVGFLIVAMRYLNSWLGLAMILQAIQFSLHAYYLIAEKQHDYLYRLINNVNTVAILLVILTATLMTWRRRSQTAEK